MPVAGVYALGEGDGDADSEPDGEGEALLLFFALDFFFDEVVLDDEEVPDFFVLEPVEAVVVDALVVDELVVDEVPVPVFWQAAISATVAMTAMVDAMDFFMVRPARMGTRETNGKHEKIA